MYLTETSKDFEYFLSAAKHAKLLENFGAFRVSCLADFVFRLGFIIHYLQCYLAEKYSAT